MVGPSSHSALALRVLAADFGAADCKMNNLVVDGKVLILQKESSFISL